jgi:DNA-directed RNA polymerase specialized sigma24 family protein
MNLCAWLMMVSDPALPPRERNGAASRIRSNLNGWARPYLFRVAPCRLGDDDVDEAVQHLLTRCALGASRFKGTSEGEAHSWCMRVLLNKGRDLCREKRRMISTTVDDDDEGRAPREPSVDPDLRGMAMKTIQEVFEAIQLELPRLHRRQDIEGIMRSVRCHLEARLGATIEEQIATYGDGAPTTGKEATRAQNRVYQYRNRGRKAACEALSSLVAQGRFAPEDVEDARRLLGCDIGAEEKDKEKKALS